MQLFSTHPSVEDCCKWGSPKGARCVGSLTMMWLRWTTVTVTTQGKLTASLTRLISATPSHQGQPWWDTAPPVGLWRHKQLHLVPPNGMPQNLGKFPGRRTPLWPPQRPTSQTNCLILLLIFVCVTQCMLFAQTVAVVLLQTHGHL